MAKAIDPIAGSSAALSDGRFLFIDCETTGLPRTRGFDKEDVSGWPRLVQLAWAVYGHAGTRESVACRIVRPDGFRIPEDAARIHGIRHEDAMGAGLPLDEVLDEFLEAAANPGLVLVAHNFEYDYGVIAGELVRTKRPLEALDKPAVCTMRATTDFCGIPHWKGGFKWPTLAELYKKIFQEDHDGAHDAAVDLAACARCFFRLLEDGRHDLFPALSRMPAGALRR